MLLIVAVEVAEVQGSKSLIGPEETVATVAAEPAREDVLTEYRISVLRGFLSSEYRFGTQWNLPFENSVKFFPWAVLS